jgi:cytochrome c-type biogenesis protein
MLLAVGVLLVTGVWEDWTRALQTQLVNGFVTVI